MAIKSTILRPIGDRFNGLEVSSYIATYPSRTLSNDSTNVLYDLINDETPDDDSSYFEYLEVKSVLKPTVTIAFDCSSLNNLKYRIKNAKIHIIAKCLELGDDTIKGGLRAIAWAQNVQLSNCKSMNSINCITTNLFTADNLNTYLDQTIEFPEFDNLLKYFDFQTVSNLYVDIYQDKIETSGSSGSKSYTYPVIRITSVYIEVFYEDSDLGNIFLKQNNMWENIPVANIFKKEGNTWVNKLNYTTIFPTSANHLDLDDEYVYVKDFNIIFPTNMATGTCKLYKNSKNEYKLIIAGSGAMSGFSSTPSIWGDYQSLITHVVVEAYDNLNLILGSYIFAGCLNLKSAQFIGNVELGASCFYGCSSLHSIEIDTPFPQIPDDAFSGCYNLRDVNSILRGLIGSSSFYECLNLKSVVIPNSTFTVESDAYFSCINLKDLVISDALTNIKSSAFKNCYSLANITISQNSNLTSISDYAFEHCTNLTKIIIPANVTYVGNYAFNSCPNLTIYCEAESKPSGWEDNWNDDNCPVVWGYTWED